MPIRADGPDRITRADRRAIARVQRRPKPRQDHYGPKGAVVRAGEGGQNPVVSAFGFLGDAARGAGNFVRSVAPGQPTRRPRPQVRAGHEALRQLAEQSGMAAIDRMRRGEFRREDAMLLASMGIALTPGGAALRGGQLGRLGGNPVIQGSLGDLLTTLMQARQRMEYNRQNRRRR